MTALHVQIPERSTAPLPVFTTLRLHNRHAQETR
jgi:hypothetical protein